MQIAIQAIRNNKDLSVRGAAKIYNMLETTLRDRTNRKRARQDTRANLKKMTELEEEAI
ncbi:hypothetical protein IMZ48_15840, partial [Candidatus Bathyarchaeota archaeon]|nr:hypothetical protein [Candidatus Bathyarchaeota archaeon]